jgi:hypothetical protein
MSLWSERMRNAVKKGIGTLVLLFVLGQPNGYALTSQEEKATHPEDLGTETVDVSSYPQNQQDNYRLFLKKCSACHSPARALNSKIVSEEDWEHFVSLMHGRLMSRGMKPVWQPGEGRRIIEFLAYDSQIRKIDHKLAFEENLRQLRVRFAEVQKEKAEKAKHQPTKASAPYTGANP